MRAIVAIGNSMRRDDGVGQVILHSLKLNPSIKVFDLGSDLFPLSEILEEFESVIILDALVANASTGSVKVIDLHQIPTHEISCATSTHGFDLFHFIELNKKRKIPLPKSFFLVGVVCSDCKSLGEGLTKVVKNSVPKAVEEVYRLIEE